MMNEFAGFTRFEKSLIEELRKVSGELSKIYDALDGIYQEGEGQTGGIENMNDMLRLIRWSIDDLK